jgi:hypothetical protein
VGSSIHDRGNENSTDHRTDPPPSGNPIIVPRFVEPMQGTDVPTRLFHLLETAEGKGRVPSIILTR